MDEVNLDRFYPVKQLLVDQVSDALLVENIVIFSRLIQSQTQGGP